MTKIVKTVNDVKVYVMREGRYVLEHPSSGDVVQLRGIKGPEMTIEAFQVKSLVGGDEEEYVEEYVRCIWFDGNVLHRNTFYGNMLVKVR